MHIGSFLRNEAEKQRLSTSDIGKLVNKTPQAVRKDFEKPVLQMAVLESFAKALNINIYEILAAEWAGNPYPEKTTKPQEHQIVEDERPQLDRKTKNLETVSVTFQIPATKKEALLKLLTS